MSEKISSYQDLIVWQKAMDFAEACYNLSSSFPVSEVYTLTSQLRRSAISIPSNIAEGNGRDSIVDYIRFLNIARGSLKEAETQLLLAQRFKYLNQKQITQVLTQTKEISILLNSLIRSLKQKIS